MFAFERVPNKSVMRDCTSIIHLIQDVVNEAWPRIPDSDPHCVHLPVPRFSFDALEGLWDHYKNPRQLKAYSPRAVYELDCADWIRAPSSSDNRSRGIMHLACLSQNSALHVLSDVDKLHHVRRFTDSVNNEVPRDILSMDDRDIMFDHQVLDAISFVAGLHFLLDAGSMVYFATPFHARDSPCAWFVLDEATGTWSARIFPGDLLCVGVTRVKAVAFLHAVAILSPGTEPWSSCTFTVLRDACKHASIPLDYGSHTETTSLVDHIKKTLLFETSQDI